MTLHLQSLVRGVKRKDAKTRPKQQHGTAHRRLPSQYEEGVRMAKEAMEVYAKELKKIK